MNNLKKRIDRAMYIINEYSSAQDAHHKQWIIDQVARYLLMNDYSKWILQQENWDVGIEP